MLSDSKFFLVLLSGTVVLAVGSSTYGEKVSGSKKPAAKKADLLNVEKQVSEPLRETEQTRKELERKASAASSIKEEPAATAFPNAWDVSCTPNNDRCVPQKIEKPRKLRSDGLEIK